MSDESPEEVHSRRVQFEKYYAMQSLLVRIKHAGGPFALQAAEILAGDFSSTAEQPLAIGDAVTVERYRARGEHEGWFVSDIRYDVKHPQGGWTNCTAAELLKVGELPPTHYVFLTRRPIDSQAWPAIPYADRSLAEKAYCRASALVPVRLVEIPPVNPDKP